MPTWNDGLFDAAGSYGISQRCLGDLHVLGQKFASGVRQEEKSSRGSCSPRQATPRQVRRTSRSRGAWYHVKHVRDDTLLAHVTQDTSFSLNSR
jgi:hypothetical protein